MALTESMRGSSQSIRVPVWTPDTFSTTWRPFRLKVVVDTLGAQLERRMTTSESQRSDFGFRYRKSVDNRLTSVYCGRGVRSWENRGSGHSKLSPNTSDRLERRLLSGQRFSVAVMDCWRSNHARLLLSAEQSTNRNHLGVGLPWGLAVGDRQPSHQRNVLMPCWAKNSLSSLCVSNPAYLDE